MKVSLIVKSITNWIFPFVLLYGIYIILHGTSSPGGGFQGGVVIGVAFILLSFSYDQDQPETSISKLYLKLAESAGILIFIGIGIVGIVMGYAFLANKAIGFPPQGIPGNLFSGGAALGINIGIGIHVASTIITLFYTFLEN